MPKRYLTGGGKDLKNQRKSKDYQYKISGFVKFYIKKIFSEKTSILSDRRVKKILDATSRCHGAILIEFAVCMPVLIILLFYIHDLVKIKRLYSQTEFVAQQMANILQNIAKTREITKNDIKYAASLAYLTIYPGTTMYADGKRGNQSHELSHRPEFCIYYVKGLPEGKASVKWGWNGYCHTSTSPKTWGGGYIKSDSNRHVVRWREDTDASNIYPTLKINGEKGKVILECLIYNDANTMSSTDYKASDNQNDRAKKAFKLRLVNPKAVYADSIRGYYFPSVVIFTPHCGFTEKAPE